PPASGANSDDQPDFQHTDPDSRPASDRTTTGALPPSTPGETTSDPANNQHTPTTSGSAPGRTTTGAFPPQTSGEDSDRSTDRHDTQPTSNSEPGSSTDGIILPPGSSQGRSTASKTSQDNNVSSNSHAGTRTVTPPPYPHSTETDDHKARTASWTNGPPSPTCTGKDCGKKCDGRNCEPCGEHCNDHDESFKDPGDRDPPKGNDNRKCTGLGCHKGKCGFWGPICATFDCIGLGCHDGVCLSSNCVKIPCVGTGCLPGCKGPRCKKASCIGDCAPGLLNECTGPKCLSFGCTGPQCLPPCSGCAPVCMGPDCQVFECSGTGCKDGFCKGPDCKQEKGDCEEPDTAPRCTEVIAKYKRTESVYSSTTKTRCSTVTACSVTETTVTTTTTVDKGEIITITEHYPVQTLLSDEEYASIAKKLREARIERDKSRFGPTTTEDEPTKKPSRPKHTAADEGKPDCMHDKDGTADRGELIKAISYFCSRNDGVSHEPQLVTTRGACNKDSDADKCVSYITLGAKYLDGEGCDRESLTFDGKGTVNDQCGQNFRQVVDKCNTKGENKKEGGSFSTKCQMWWIDIESARSWRDRFDEEKERQKKENESPHTPDRFFVHEGVVGDAPGADDGTANHKKDKEDKEDKKDKKDKPKATRPQDKGDLKCASPGDTDGKAKRSELIDAIYEFCTKYDGVNILGVRKPKDSGNFVLGSSECDKNGKCNVDFKLGISLSEAEDQCGPFISRGNGTVDDQCGQNFRQIVDKCDTDGENDKHGGVFSRTCARWIIKIQSSYTSWKETHDEHRHDN
ncbi:hypothetical protein FQN49_005974, partial [Arthroderma sp. PD_2]